MPISIVAEANLDAAKRQYIRAKKAYYNDTPIMNDPAFNRLEDQIRKADPTWSELKKTGVKVVDKKTEVRLERFMPSLDKTYPEGMAKLKAKPWARKVTSWLKMHKLDGTSLQLVYQGSSKNRLKPTRLMTRGDGADGKDISFFIPWLVRLKKIPATLKADSDTIVLRLEGIMELKTFRANWSLKKRTKKQGGWDNIRNGVNGAFNKMTEPPQLKDIDLVVLGVYGYTIASGLYHAERWGFNVVAHELLRDADVTADKFSAALEAERKTSKYEMDGFVFCAASFNMVFESNKRPKELMAFKFNDEENADQVEVVSFVWQKTRLKRWQPKITIPPTQMDGVVVTNATAHNPAWLMERGIGPGAIVKVLRSGGVIPKIVGVVKKSKFIPPPGPYEIRGRFFYMTEGDKTSDVRAIHFFMTTLGIELLAAKTLTKLYDAGFTSTHSYIQLMEGTDSVGPQGKYLRRAHGAFVNAGIGANMATKLLAELRRGLTSKILLKNLMIASGAFEKGGMGRDKLKQLEDQGLSMAKLCNMKAVDFLPEITRYKGFSDKTALILRDGVTQFRKWYKPVANLLTVDGKLPPKKTVTGSLTGVKVAWTSYRDAAQEKLVIDLGGEVVKSGPRMDVLLYKKGAKFMDKINAAGSKAMTWEQFVAKYKVNS
jgi:DNA ligase (NAD+)